MKLGAASSRDRARRILVSLALPEVVLAIFDAKVPQVLSVRCRELLHGYSAGALLPDGDVPLWECSMVPTAWLPDDAVFTMFSLEEPETLWWTSTSVDEVTARLLIDLFEDELAI